MRQTIFISHASPEDDDFARWLSLQLISLGYDVWCDVLKLKGGEDWWPLIENEIRNNTIKYLFVLSNNSNHKDGVLKELAVAQKTKLKLDDQQFIIPLHIDSTLSYDDINVELIRLNSINFKNSWVDGLRNLLELFNEFKVNKSGSNYGLANELWQSIYLHGKQPIQEEEIYLSNWYPIIEMPKLLRFHYFKHFIPDDFVINSLPYPAFIYKKYYLATFAYCYDFMEELPRTDQYRKSQSIEMSVDEIINSTYTFTFIQNKIARNIIVHLLNMAFDKAMQNNKNISVYLMSNKMSYWIKKGVLEKDKYEKILLVGKQKEKHWHFGISGNAKLFPELSFTINSHIWFTSNGENLIPSPSIQHAARRRQGKSWWNNDWRNKNIAFMKYLSESDGAMQLPLGREELCRISNEAILFKSPLRYIDPNKDNLPSDDYDFTEEDDDITEKEIEGKKIE